jgi:sulfate adenylyltransferase
MTQSSSAFHSSSSAAAAALIAPHGGELVNLMVTDASEKAALLASATRTLELSDRNACDVELLANGGFSPLKGFMNEDVYQGCVENMRLPGSNLLFGMPIVLDTTCEDTKVGDKVLLQYQGKPVGVITVESKWKPNKPLEGKMCYGTSSIEHPGVAMISGERAKYYIGGSVKAVDVPDRPFPCPDPAAVRSMLPAGKDVVVGGCTSQMRLTHS